MKRYRRNEEFRLTAPTARPVERRPHLAELSTLGIVINPKLNEPLLVTTDGEYVSIRSLKDAHPLQKHGTGYYEESRDEAADATDYPRAHTPDGVTPRGAGYGTSLYSALCLGAYLADGGPAEIAMGVKGEGISSRTENRSSDADSWWRAALDRGLTDQKDESEREEDVDITRDVDADDIDTKVDGEIVYVNRVNVDIERSVYYDYYTYKSLVSHHLLVAEFVVKMPEELRHGIGPRSQWQPDLRHLWRTILDEPDLIYDTEGEPLLAIDVRGLSEDAINLLSLLYLHSGLKDADVDSLRERWARNLDPGYVSPQQQLFRANAAGMADVQWARQQVDWRSLAGLP